MPGIFANRTHVEQIIMNLLINAREALAGIPDPEIVLSLEGERGESRVSVSDNGPGVPPELEERIFEEAFTTRGDSGGSGLGLMMAATLAELNGARVSLTDNSTRGATFTLTFSLKSRHVVVVEPDPLFRAELVTALQDGGWEVSALHDGAGFKETFRGLSRPPAAVITELILPGAGARSLVSDITADMPSVPIFAVTSLALPEAIDGFKKLGISEVLSKLLLKEELLKRLTAHLEEDL